MRAFGVVLVVALHVVFPRLSCLETDFLRHRTSEKGRRRMLSFTHLIPWSIPFDARSVLPKKGPGSALSDPPWNSLRALLEWRLMGRKRDRLSSNASREDWPHTTDPLP